MKKPQCPHCGQEFKGLKDGKIPTHDFPPPCRAVCPGSKEEPRQHDDTPLWKDDPKQRERDFYEGCRRELQVYGFAVVKEIAGMRSEKSGTMDCPLCGIQLKFRLAANGHCAAKCGRDGCINMME